MTDDQILTQIREFEACKSWMYLDTDSPPNVTIASGCLLASVTDALKLAFQRVIDGAPASQDEISAEYFRVKAMPGGLLAKAYRGAIELPAAAVDELDLVRLRQTYGGLVEIFPGFDGFPGPAQAALFDLGWNCGTGRHLPGLGGWTHLLGACNAVPPNWGQAAQECTTANPTNNPGRAERNVWRQGRFRACLATS